MPKLHKPARITNLAALNRFIRSTTVEGSGKQLKTTTLEETKPPAPGRLMVPSLTISNLATRSSIMVTNLLLVDIAGTFAVPVGIAGQIRTIASAVAVMTALAMGVLSIRFSHKLILMTGLGLIGVSALGCYLAPDFTTMLLAYSISGIGVAMVQPMCHAIVGEHLPVEKRGSAVAWNLVGMGLAYLIGAPVIGFLGDWRLGFLAFALPLASLSLFLSLRALPSHQAKGQVSGGLGSYLGGFREVLSSRSAIACLFGSILVLAPVQVVAVYGVAFYRQRFLMSPGSASMIVTAGMLVYIPASLAAGRLVNRLGRKPLTIVAASLLGICVSGFIYAPDLVLSLALVLLAMLFSGVSGTSRNSLTLEQAPKFRGTMMSLNQVAQSMGETLGISLGGAILLSYGYEMVGLSLGAVGILGALVFLFLTIDPTRTKTHN